MNNPECPWFSWESYLLQDEVDDDDMSREDQQQLVSMPWIVQEGVAIAEGCHGPDEGVRLTEPGIAPWAPTGYSRVATVQATQPG